MDFNIDTAVMLSYIKQYGLNILFALVIFFIGKRIARLVATATEKAMRRVKMDQTLIAFSSKVIYGLLIVIVIIAALNQLGVETSSLLAVLATAGLAIGLALKDSLSNLAAGVMIIIFRPFSVGNYIETAKGSGFVRDIGIFTTTLTTPDNKKIIIPNNAIMTESITNYSAVENRRIDLVFGCSYSDDLRKVKQILHDVVAADDRILPEPAPWIAVSELADSSVNFIVRPWVKASDYWDTRFDLIEQVKLAFDDAGVSIPFPQRDVHLHQVAEQSDQ